MKMAGWQLWRVEKFIEEFVFVENFVLETRLTEVVIWINWTNLQIIKGNIYGRTLYQTLTI